MARHVVVTHVEHPEPLRVTLKSPFGPFVLIASDSKHVTFQPVKPPAEEEAIVEVNRARYRHLSVSYCYDGCDWKLSHLYGSNVRTGHQLDWQKAAWKKLSNGLRQVLHDWLADNPRFLLQADVLDRRRACYIQERAVYDAEEKLREARERLATLEAELSQAQDRWVA